MSAIFLKLVNMSIAAGWIVLAVCVLRFLLRKAPKWSTLILWGFVAVRLVCPVSIESIFSLIPSVQTFPTDMTSRRSFNINSGLPYLNSGVNEYLDSHYYEGVTVPAENTKHIVDVLMILWVIGVLLMLGYAVFSYLRVNRQVREAVFLKDNVWVCDKISTPFILGILKPRIYLPSVVDETDRSYVLSHENAHLKRKDHIWKPFGFLLLAIYWFHPLLWVAYFLLCRDIELSCDEKVIQELVGEDKKAYAEALLNCSAPRKMIVSCPLAFGENGVKQRVKSILHYKKPAFWMVIVALIACVAAGVCLLTNPKQKKVEEVLKDNPERVVFFYEGENILQGASLTLFPKTKRCNFSISFLSSYYPVGSYEETDAYIVMKADDREDTYTFRKRGANLIFVAEKSREMPAYRYSAGGQPEVSVPDGAVFRFREKTRE